MREKYNNFMRAVLELRADGEIRHRDITILVAMMQWVDFDIFCDVKNRRIANLLDMDKSDVSKAIKKIKECKIILENDKGYKLNENLYKEIMSE